MNSTVKQWYDAGVVRNGTDVQILNQYVLKESGWKDPIEGEVTNDFIARSVGANIIKVEDIINKYSAYKEALDNEL